jgi:hypothetical protein
MGQQERLETIASSCNGGADEQDGHKVDAWHHDIEIETPKKDG